MDKLGQLIPDVYYDPIARIVPGTLFCIAISLDSRFQLAAIQKVPSAISEIISSKKLTI
jgi:hypothetical protein